MNGLPILPPQGNTCVVPSAVDADVRRLQFLTIGWMLIECSIALFAAARAHSVALLAFGSDSFVELLSAGVVLAQYSATFRISKETASRVAGTLLFVLAAVVTLVSMMALIRHTEADTSLPGITITLGALLIMPVLAVMKRKKAREAGDRALLADAAQSATCAYLAAVTLLGLLVNYFFAIRWIDSLAALLAVPVLIYEGRQSLKGEVCGCC